MVRALSLSPGSSSLRFVLFGLISILFVFNQRQLAAQGIELDPDADDTWNYTLIVEAGYGVSIDDLGDLNVTMLNVVNGFRHNDFLSLGAGVGLRNYAQQRGMVVPVSVDFRFHPFEKKSAPMLDFAMGYAWLIDNNPPVSIITGEQLTSVSDGGFHLAARLGYRIVTSGGNAWHILLGFDRQNIRNTRVIDFQEGKYRNLRTTTLTVGYAFR